MLVPVNGANAHTTLTQRTDLWLVPSGASTQCGTMIYPNVRMSNGGLSLSIIMAMLMFYLTSEIWMELKI